MHLCRISRAQRFEYIVVIVAVASLAATVTAIA